MTCHRIKDSVFKNPFIKKLYGWIKGKKDYICPICGYTGPFWNMDSSGGVQKDSRCPGCRSLERHRLQFLVMEKIFSGRDPKGMRMLHAAPEGCLRDKWQRRFQDYVSIDLEGKRESRREDLTRLSFDDGSFDVVYASHVLEHIQDDEAALAEIRRVLKPGGFAVLPVPVTASRTVEYEKPNPAEDGHVRRIGLDYFDKYGKYFDEVKLYSSEDFDSCYQTYICESRPGPAPTPGQKDYVPVCYKKNDGH